MSAFQVSPEHVNAVLVSALGRPGMTPVAADKATEYGRMLMRANVENLIHCYPNDNENGEDAFLEADTFKADIFAKRPEPVIALKLLASLEYQCADLPTWDSSPGARLCNQIRHHLIQSLPGYTEAPWEI